MDERNFHDKLAEVMEKIRKLPQQPAPSAEDTDKTRKDRIQSTIQELQDSLDYLRLSVKYLVFDLEATRRENAYLRRLIEQSNRGSSSQQTGENDNFLDDEQSGAD